MIDMSILLNMLQSTDNPLLPPSVIMRMAGHGLWAIVLVCGAWLLSSKLQRPYRLLFCFGIMVWTLIPGSTSPAYWLGLAFQAPSLMSAVLGLVWLVRGLTISSRPLMGDRCLRIFVVLGGVLGWVLLLDTLALLPVSVYAWGFSSAALGVVAVITALLWVVLGGAPGNVAASGAVGPVLVLSVLVLFVVTRLPSGNLWDALIDPLLWLGLQGRWLVSGVRYLRATRRLPPAIHVGTAKSADTRG